MPSRSPDLTLAENPRQSERIVAGELSSADWQKCISSEFKGKGTALFLCTDWWIVFSIWLVWVGFNQTLRRQWEIVRNEGQQLFPYRLPFTRHSPQPPPPKQQKGNVFLVCMFLFFSDYSVCAEAHVVMMVVCHPSVIPWKQGSCFQNSKKKRPYLKNNLAKEENPQMILMVR